MSSDEVAEGSVPVSPVKVDSAAKSQQRPHGADADADPDADADSKATTLPVDTVLETPSRTNSDTHKPAEHRFAVTWLLDRPPHTRVIAEPQPGRGLG